MAIQLRIQHTQGEQVIALSPRTLDDPLVVGRSEDADIVIPSPDISKRHCTLFVHERKWMIQDNGSRVGTFVGGERVTQPRMLNIGDEVTFGAPVVMIVEPLSIAAPTPAPVAAPSPVEEPSDESTEEESTEDDDEAAFDAAAVSTPTTHFYVPKKKPLSGAVIGVTIAIIAALVGVAIWAVMGVEKKKEAAQTIVVVEEPKPAEPKNIFDFPEQNKPAAKPAAPVAPVETKSEPTPAPPLAPKPTIVRAPTPPKAQQLDDVVEGMQRPSPVTASKEPDPVDTTPPPPPPAPTQTPPVTETTTIESPLRTSPEWERVEAAHRTAPPAEAIWVFTSYLSNNPDTPFKSDLDAFTADAFDRLWWYRIKELCEQVVVVRMNLQKIDNDIKVETNAKMKKQFQADRKKVDADLQEKLTTLKEMSYELPDPPDVYDDVKLSELRPKRNAEYYEKWKKARLSSIKYTRGRSAY